MIIEEWRDIPGYEGLYQASNLGNIRNVRTGRILKYGKSKTGYYQISLRKEKHPYTFYVHRLVAIVFIPNPEGLSYINHRDENKHNNCVENLEWCTCKYNINYGDAQKKRVKSRGKTGYHSILNNPGRSKPVAQYTLDGVLVTTYPSRMEGSRQTGVDKNNMWKCLKGKAKTCGGFIWKYL